MNRREQRKQRKDRIMMRRFGLRIAAPISDRLQDRNDLMGCGQFYFGCGFAALIPSAVKNVFNWIIRRCRAASAK
jgi:hypothetical protein